MKTIIIFLLLCVAVSAQVKTNVITTNKTIKEVTTITVDSVSLEGFIKRYLDRNSVTSAYTLTEIDNAVGASAGSSVTLGTLTASGLYTSTVSGTTVNARQLYYKPLLINGAQIGKLITTEIP